MNIVFLGSPGAGKGTQALKLSQAESFFHISTGDIFRAELKNNTPLGVKAKEYIDKGELVPDDLVVDMVEKKISELGDGKGCLLDGFPRNLAQAKAMEDKIPIELAIFIHVDEDEIVKRLSSRRTCKECGNLQSVKDGEACAKCGGEVYQRDDDRKDVIMNRLNVYNEQTKPLIKYYEDKSILFTVDGSRDVDQVYGDVLALVKKNDRN